MLSPQFVNRNLVVRIQSLFLSLPTVPLLLSSILGTGFWRGPLKPLAADTSGTSSHLNLVLVAREQKGLLPDLYSLLMRHQPASLKLTSSCLQTMCSCLFLTSFHVSLPLFRDLLTTAPTQVCTVIRFSQSRFVPPSRLIISPRFLSGCREAKHSLTVSDAAKICSFPQFFPSLWTVLGISFTPLHPRP